jgi:hypothetical protein
MDIIILILLTLGIISVTVSWIKADLQCPPPTIVYKYIPKHTLDVQFSEEESENMPSTIYKDMFTAGTPWIGGYQLGTKGITTVVTSGSLTSITMGSISTSFITPTTTTSSEPATALATSQQIITR